MRTLPEFINRFFNPLCVSVYEEIGNSTKQLYSSDIEEGKYTEEDIIDIAYVHEFENIIIFVKPKNKSKTVVYYEIQERIAPGSPLTSFKCVVENEDIAKAMVIQSRDMLTYIKREATI